MSEMTTRQDAKALYHALDELAEVIGRLDIKGNVGDVEDYDQAKYEAEIMLQALAGEYDDG